MTNLELWRKGVLQRGGFDNIWSFFDDLNRGFDTPAGQSQSREAPVALRCDVTEVENTFVISLDAPGIKKEDISIELSEGKLTISGERKREEETKTGQTHRIERYFGKFQRTFELPESVNADQIEASFENGVLQISVPKSEVQEKVRKIQIGEAPKGFLRRLVSKEKEGAKAGNA
jgi:HSP20 family protein